MSYKISFYDAGRYLVEKNANCSYLVDIKIPECSCDHYLMGGALRTGNPCHHIDMVKKYIENQVDDPNQLGLL